MESFNCVCWHEVGSEFLQKQWPPGKHRFARSRKKLIHDFKVSTAHVQNINGRYISTRHIESQQKPSFFNYFHSKVFFFILDHVCFTFRIYVTKMECLCKYSNHCFVFWIGNIFLILLSTYLENTRRNIILCAKMLLLANKSHVLISMIEVKIEM